MVSMIAWPQSATPIFYAEIWNMLKVKDIIGNHNHLVMEGKTGNQYIKIPNSNPLFLQCRFVFSENTRYRLIEIR